MKADLTAKEQAHVRTALKFLRTRCGGWVALARALGFAKMTLTHVAQGRKAVSASVAFRIARLANVTVDDVLAGRFPNPNACPYCGHSPTADDGEVPT